MAGANYGEGRGNITIAASYDKINGTLANSRQRFFEGIGTGTNPLATSGNALIPGRTPGNDGRVNPNIPFNTGNADGIPNSVYIRDTRIFGTSWAGLLLPATGAVNTAAGIPRGFGANNALFQFAPDGTLVTYNPGIPFGTQNASGGDGISIIRDTQQLTSGLTRITGNVIAEYEIVDDARVFFEGTYYNARASELIDQSIYNSSLFGGLSAPLLFSATDPRLTTQARTTLASLGVTSFRLSRASRDLVNNNASGVTEVIRGVVGITGEAEILGRRWNYEMSANYGRGDSTFTQNVLNQQRFVNAINNCVVTGVTAANNVAPGGILPIADANCVPLDVFGEGRPSAAAKAYVTSATRAKAILEQEVYSANIGTSELITLWSGGVGFNVGAERRTERAQFISDEFQRLGLGRAVPIAGNRGQFTTNEVSVELYVPLVSPKNEIPLIHSLTAEAKARYVNNTVNGGFWAYTYGGQWSPIKDIQFRGNYTRSLRAPSVVELFTPVSPAFNTFPDPCDSTQLGSGPNPTVRAANCAAFFASYGLSSTSFQSAARTATVPITSGGNVSLANEEGRSYTFGVVLQPSFIPRFRAAVDWNRIRIAGNIASLTPQNIAEGCYDNPNFNTADVDNANQFCSLIRRDRSADPARNGQLSNNAARPGLVTNFVNGAFIEFRGLTAEVDYNFPIGDVKVDLGGSLFYLENLKQSNNGVTITDNQKTLGNPEFSGQLNVGLTSGPLGVDFQANYQSTQWIGLRTDTVETRDVLTVPDVWTFNLATSLKVQENSIMRFNVSNLFDRLPPYPIVGNGLGVYDWIGRRFTVSFEHKF